MDPPKNEQILTKDHFPIRDFHKKFKMFFFSRNESGASGGVLVTRRSNDGNLWGVFCCQENSDSAH